MLRVLMLVLFLAFAGPVHAQGSGPSLLVDYSSDTLAPWTGDPYADTLMRLAWAWDHGPLSPGHTQKRAVLLLVHGGYGYYGNTFKAKPDANLAPYTIAPQQKTGCVVASINYPLLTKPAESYRTWQLSYAARAVQFLRTHADALNIDPSLVFLMGASHGGLMAADLVWGADFATAGRDSIASQSSRPDFLILLNTPSYFLLLAAAEGCPPASYTGLGYPTYQDLSKAAAQALSPVTTLSAYRGEGAPTALVYVNPVTPFPEPTCNPHDGVFGLLLWEQLGGVPHAYIHEPEAGNLDFQLAVWLDDLVPPGAQGSPGGGGIGHH